LLRFNPDGSLDSTFRATAGFPGETLGFAVQPDGKLLVAGGNYVGDHAVFGLARYDPSGPTLDPDFGIGGQVTTTFDSADAVAKGVVLEPDSKIVLVGAVMMLGQPTRLALVRYNTDSSLHTSFGVNGRVTTLVASGGYGAAAAAVQPDGNIIVVGTSLDPDRSLDFAVLRYLGNDFHGSSGVPASAALFRGTAGFPLTPAPAIATGPHVPALPAVATVDRVFAWRDEQPPLLSVSRHANHTTAGADPFGAEPWVAAPLPLPTALT